MTTLPRPGPEDPNPLSAREKKVLTQIEDDLVASAPELSALADSLGRGPPRSWTTMDRVVRVGLAIVLVLAVVPAQWLPVLMVFGIMVGLPVAATLVGWWGPGEPPNRHQGE